ncbi:MAG: MBOAT family protein [Lachnospiraceae bacterium]|nr:MBOAT family protein [Lachnospiraceae bacterium]
MIFSSYEFLLVFFPIVTIVYWIFCTKKLFDAAKIWLVAASFYFYAQGSPSFFPFFLGSVLANYVLGISMCSLQGSSHKLERALILAIGVLGNVGLLGYYKYMNFFLGNLNSIFGTNFPLKSVLLPIGISFFTFQLIAFLVDCYRGLTKEYSILEYLLFITFFPQLIVGPIVHHAEITPQFENEENLRLNFNNVALGIFFFTIGCAKKMLLADPMNESADAFYSSINDSIPIWESWFYTLEYSISYYFDLSGYTDMAIGLGLFFNIKLPYNFQAPWKSRNMQEYWQRQHMTLSRFLGNYIFKNVFKKGVWWRNYYVATMCTFLVSGIWHGAGWNFIIWGIINGLLVCRGAYEKRYNKYPPKVIGMILTFFGIVLTRVIFVAHSIGDAFTVYRSMFSPSAFSSGFSSFLEFFKDQDTLLPLVIIGVLICYLAPTTQEMADSFKADKRHFAFVGVLLTICLLKMNQVVQFLYFQF